jgi:hypothetical protein
MIQYSSINDAWGNKEMFKNKKPSVTPKINYDTPMKKEEIIKTEPSQEAFTEQFTDVISKKDEQKVTCDAVDHLLNCDKCLKKLKEKFSNKKNIKNYEINLFNYKFIITKEILQGVFVFLILCIFLLLLSSINQSLKPTDMKYYVLPNNAIYGATI